MPASGTVLYVEDEEGDALFMRLAFKKAGSPDALHVVADGQAAIDYLSGVNSCANRELHPLPTVVLLDLNLPNVHGFEVLRWLRQQLNYASLPVVIFSSSTSADDRLKARELGSDDFIEKPSSGLDFLKVARKLQEKYLVTGK